MKKIITFFLFLGTLLSAYNWNPLYSTYFGGSNEEVIEDVYSPPLSSLIYVVGFTSSPNFPVTSDAYETSFNGDTDAFYMIYSMNGSLVYSTYFGGSGEDDGEGIFVDSSGNVYICGCTDSLDFPLTPDAYDENLTSPLAAFYSVFYPNGSLKYSTYVGGSNDSEMFESIYVFNNKIYLAGYTNSTDYPVTTDAYDSSYNGGGSDVVYSIFDANTNALIYSTYIGGSGFDRQNGLYVDESTGDVYISGYTSSSDFPTTAGAFDTSFNGDYDGFWLKFDSSNNLVYSTYFGGSGEDEVGGIFKYDDRIYIGGLAGPGLPTTTDAYDSIYNGNGDAFFAIFNSDGTLNYSTYIGGSEEDCVADAVIDSSDEKIYIIGETESSDFPTTAGAFDTSFNGDSDMFLFIFNPNKSLNYSSFYGGSSLDEGGPFILEDGIIYAFGSTESNDFPITWNSNDPTYNGGGEGGPFIMSSNDPTYNGSGEGRQLMLKSISEDGIIYAFGSTESNDFPITWNFDGSSLDSDSGGGDGYYLILGPEIYVIRPTVGFTYSIQPDLQVGSYRPLSDCIFSLNSAPNQTMTRINSTYFVANITSISGMNEIYVYCSNTLGLWDRAYTFYYIAESGSENEPYAPICGNEICEIGENYTNCPQDCPRPVICGDNICDPEENCLLCPADCGLCEKQSYCGDGVCDLDESPSSCPQDCPEILPRTPECGKHKPCKVGYQCLDGVCVLLTGVYRIEAPLEAKVNSRIYVGLYKGNSAVENASIFVIYPDGSKHRYVTNVDGKISFIADTPGFYKYDPLVPLVDTYGTYVFPLEDNTTMKKIEVPFYVQKPSQLKVEVYSNNKHIKADLVIKGPEQINSKTNDSGEFVRVLNKPGKYIIVASASGVNSLSMNIKLNKIAPAKKEFNLTYWLLILASVTLISYLVVHRLEVAVNKE